MGLKERWNQDSSCSADRPGILHPGCGKSLCKSLVSDQVYILFNTVDECGSKEHKFSLCGSNKDFVSETNISFLCRYHKVDVIFFQILDLPRDKHSF